MTMRHNDPLFDLVQDAFRDFSPEVPPNAYAGIRAKMKKKRSFWSFAFNSLNVYYVGAALTAGLLAMSAFNNRSTYTADHFEQIHAPFSTVLKAQQTIAIGEQVAKDQANAEPEEIVSHSNGGGQFVETMRHQPVEMIAKNECNQDAGNTNGENRLSGNVIEPVDQLPAKILPLNFQGFGSLKASSILDQVALPGDEIVLTIPVHVEVEKE